MTAPAPIRTGFSSLRHRNFRLFLTGQFLSLIGSWIHNVAQGWLVLELSQSAFTVGLVSSLGSLPILLFTLYGGVVADRVDKRRLITVLQVLMLVEGLALAVLTHTGTVTVPLVTALAIVLGILVAFEVPARQAFVVDLAGKEDLMNAIALSSSAFNVSRIVGPAIAGVLIAGVGIAACFYANAASYLAVIVGLLMMKLPGREPGVRSQEKPGFLDGFLHLWRIPWSRALVILTGTFSVFGFSFMAMLPVFAQEELRVSATGYGGLVSGVGAGATGAALFVAAFGHRIRRRLSVLAGGAVFGLSLIAAAFSGAYYLALPLLILAGMAMVLNNVLTNTLLQTGAPDALRGRVMGVYSFLILGLAPFGSLQAGVIAEAFGVRTAIAAGGGICLAVTLAVGWWMVRSGNLGPSRRWRDLLERTGELPAAPGASLR